MGNRGGKCRSSRPEAPQPAEEQGEGAEPDFQGHLALHILQDMLRNRPPRNTLKEKQVRQGLHVQMGKLRIHEMAL